MNLSNVRADSSSGYSSLVVHSVTTIQGEEVTIITSQLYPCTVLTCPSQSEILHKSSLGDLMFLFMLRLGNSDSQVPFTAEHGFPKFAWVPTAVGSWEYRKCPYLSELDSQTLGKIFPAQSPVSNNCSKE